MNFHAGDVEDDLHQLEAVALRAQDDPSAARRVVRDRINFDFPVLEDFRYDITGVHLSFGQTLTYNNSLIIGCSKLKLRTYID